MEPEEVDPILESARRSALGSVMAVAAGGGAAMVIMLVIATRVVVQSDSWDAAYTLMWASFAGVCGAIRLLTYRRAYRVLTAPRNVHVPTKGRISITGAVLEVGAALVIIFTFVKYLY